MRRKFREPGPKRPEEWRDIPGYEGIYQASSEGRIRRLYKTREPRVLKQYQNENMGHRQYIVNLYGPGGPRQMTVLRLVAMAWFPRRVEGRCVVHRNGLHSDNRPTNVLIMDDAGLGARYGRMARRKGVCRVDAAGEIVEVYASMAAASAATGLACQTIRRHCEGQKVKPRPDGTTFRWDDDDKIWK